MSAYVYRYRVTDSAVPTVPVGSTLVDKRRDLVKTWTVWDSNTGTMSEFTAKRGARCCSGCFALRLVRDFAHEGEHGESVPYTPDAVAP